MQHEKLRSALVFGSKQTKPAVHSSLFAPLFSSFTPLYSLNRSFPLYLPLSLSLSSQLVDVRVLGAEVAEEDGGVQRLARDCHHEGIP